MSWLPTALPPHAIPAGLTRESSLLFHYRAAELDPALTPVSRRSALYSLTSLRSGSAWAHGSDGKLYRVPEDVPRFDFFDLDGDGICETPALCCDDPDTNLCLRWDDLSTWTTSGTVAVTDDALLLGLLAVSLVADNDGAAAAYVARTITYTGNAAKPVGVVWGKGTSPAASGGWIRVRDTTASANRLDMAVTANADGSPNVSPTTGTYLGARYLGTVSGVKLYWLEFLTASVTAANGHEIRLGGAITAGQQGNAYFGGVHTSDASRLGGPIETAAGTVTRAREVIGWTAPYAPVVAQSWLVDFIETGSVNEVSAWMAALTAGDLSPPNLYIAAGAGAKWTATHSNGSTAVQSAATVTPALWDRVRLHLRVYDDGSVQLGQSINGATMTYGTRSAANAFGAAWGNPAGSAYFWLGTLSGAQRTRLLSWKVAAGVLTDTQLARRW